ncbi:hypothetical protein ABZ599_16710 [Streptomyces misionensis]|uniref:hypothetical protein n=1 Tax=Streptomyces misionensis TaxID=67331 RepID=UPI003406669B
MVAAPTAPHTRRVFGGQPDAVHDADALFTEGVPEQGAAAHQALDEATRVDSTLVTSRLNTLLDAARPYRTAAVDEARTRTAGLAAARPTTVAD